MQTRWLLILWLRLWAIRDVRPGLKPWTPISGDLEDSHRNPHLGRRLFLSPASCSTIALSEMIDTTNVTVRPQIRAYFRAKSDLVIARRSALAPLLNPHQRVNMKPA
ncbi:hypothetical protein N7485_002789 [Penicillium canescens]|nr:hypothetical protein N7485_002789 [Penicillium canescens]